MKEITPNSIIKLLTTSDKEKARKSSRKKHIIYAKNVVRMTAGLLSKAMRTGRWWNIFKVPEGGKNELRILQP